MSEKWRIQSKFKAIILISFAINLLAKFSNKTIFPQSLLFIQQFIFGQK